MVAALATSLFTFADISYELNGGKANDYGWRTKADIALELQKDYNEVFETNVQWAKDSANHVWYMLDDKWVAADSIVPGTYDRATPGFFGAVSYAKSAEIMEKLFNAKKDKYGWLLEFVCVNRVAQGMESVESETWKAYEAALYRYEIDAFLVGADANGSWPATSSYKNATIDAYQSIWKGGYVNPTSVEGDAVVTLNKPYKEGLTFFGWYDNAEFDGRPIYTVDASTSGTLYARFVEYVPTIAEVLAKEYETVTRAGGNVTYANGKNVYLQDATGGLYVYFKEAPQVEIGQYLIIESGTLVEYKGAPELKDAVLESANPGDKVAPVTVTLAAVVAAPLNYFAQLVRLQGVKIAEYKTSTSGDNTYNDPYVTNGIDTAFVYINLDPEKFPVGKRIDMDVIAGYRDGLQFVGDPSWITLSATAGKDVNEYAVHQLEVEGENVTYTLANDWLYSVNLQNWAANKPNPSAEQCRAMVYQNGIMYFPWRPNNTPAASERCQLIRVDGETGEMLAPVLIDDKTFRNDTTGEYFFGPMTDLKLDEAGHAVSTLLPTTGGEWQVWMIDLETGAGKLLIDMTTKGQMLRDLYPEQNASAAIRFDRIGIWGDVTKDATIVAVTNTGLDIYYWEIVDGVWDGETGWFSVDYEGSKFGDGCQIIPSEGGLFYVDGFDVTPILFDFETGMVVDDFGGDAAAIAPNAYANGVTEFELGGEYFAIMGYQYQSSPAGSMILYKFADENRVFAEMMPLWVFPANGTGAASNPQRVYSSQVVPSEDNLSADIYFYVAENGYGKYTMTTTGIGSGVENISKQQLDVTIDGKTIRLSENADIALYTVTGQCVASAANANAITAPEAGAYIVKAEGKVAKVVIR